MPWKRGSFQTRSRRPKTLKFCVPCVLVVPCGLKVSKFRLPHRLLAHYAFGFALQYFTDGGSPGLRDLLPVSPKKRARACGNVKVTVGDGRWMFREQRVWFILGAKGNKPKGGKPKTGAARARMKNHHIPHHGRLSPNIPLLSTTLLS